MATRDAVDPLIHKPYLEELAAAYAPASVDRKNPSVSVLFADLVGLPPTLIQVGSAETLLDDAVRFAAEAGTRSVFVTLEIWPNMIHAWHLWTRIWKKDAGRSVMQPDFCGATLGASANPTAPPLIAVRLIQDAGSQSEEAEHPPPAHVRGPHNPAHGLSRRSGGERHR